MPTLRARHGHRDRLDDTFERARETIARSNWDPQLQSDLSQYLCVRVSGFIEQAIRDVYNEYAQRSDRRVAALVSSLMRQQLQSPNAENLIQLASRLDKVWGDELDEFLVEERRSAINGIVEKRHLIAHGEYTGISIQRLSDWYGAAKEVVAFVEKQCGV